jgi:hypothetical protein
VSESLCCTLDELRTRDGERVIVEGTVVCSPEVPLLGCRLLLDDGTWVMARLRDALDGKRVRVAGRIFTGAIPDEYGIIARTSDPYLLEITDVQTMTD